MIKQYVKIGNVEYEPKRIHFASCNKDYDMADTVDVCLVMSYEEIKTVFSNAGDWSIVTKYTTANGEVEDVMNMTDYEICCCITDTMDGYCTVKMRKASYSEILAILAGS